LKLIRDFTGCGGPALHANLRQRKKGRERETIISLTNTNKGRRATRPDGRGKAVEFRNVKKREVSTVVKEKKKQEETQPLLVTKKKTRKERKGHQGRKKEGISGD